MSIQATGLRHQPTLAGGASIFLPAYDPVFRARPLRRSEKIAHFGSPLHWIDSRLTIEDGFFDSVDDIAPRLPKFVRAFDEVVLPELARFQSEDALFEVIRRTEWSSELRLSTNSDTRGALLALMLVEREGVAAGLQWAEGEVARIRALRPLVTSQAEHQNLLRVIAHLKAQ